RDTARKLSTQVGLGCRVLIANHGFKRLDLEHCLIVLLSPLLSLSLGMSRYFRALEASMPDDTFPVKARIIRVFQTLRFCVFGLKIVVSTVRFRPSPPFSSAICSLSEL